MANSLINALKFGTGDAYGITLPYGTCSTAANTAIKAVTLPSGEIFVQDTGARISVKFSAAPGTPSATDSFQLKVGNNTAANIYSQGIPLTTESYYWHAGQIVDFVFDGTNWNMVGSQRNTNTDTNTAHKHSAGAGLIGDGNAGTSGTYSYKVALQSETKNAAEADGSETKKFYPVSLDKDGNLAVSVPWRDTTYSIANASTAGLVLSGGDVTVGSDGKMTVGNDSHTHSDTSITSVYYTKIGGFFDINEEAGTYKILSAFLPSYVDDVLEGTYDATSGEFTLTGASTAVTPEASKVYVDTTTNKTYRWSGTQFTMIASDLAIGTTSSTAAAGNHTHTLSIAAAASSDTNELTLEHSKKYKLSAGGKTYVFTTPADTHYVTGLYATTSTGTEHAATTNGNTYLRLFDNETARASIKITGSGATSVVSDASGTITISSTDNNTDAIYSGIGICSTDASTAAKVVTLPKFALATNATIIVRVNTTNSATSGVTLNVNSTGAKSIYIGGSAWSSTNQLSAGDYIATYDGTYWKLTRIYLTTNGDITGVTAGNGLTGGATSGTATLNVGAGTGISVAADTVGLDLTYLASESQTGLMSSTYYTFMVGHKHSGSADYTPAGTVSQPTFTGSAVNTAASGSTTTVVSIADVGELPSHSYTAPSLATECKNKCLTFTWSAGSHSFSAGKLPTKADGVTVATGAHVHSVTAAGTVSKPTFSGTKATISIKTGAGTNS